MKISTKLFLFLLCTISFCNIFAMENASKVDPEIMQYYAQEIRLNDSEEITKISSGSLQNTQDTLDFVTIAYRLLPSIIVREHAFVNKRLFKSFVYKDVAALPKTFDNQSEVIKDLCIKNYQQAEELRQEKQTNKKLFADLERLKDPFFKRHPGICLFGGLAIGTLVFIGSLTLYTYCSLPASASISSANS